MLFLCMLYFTVYLSKTLRTVSTGFRWTLEVFEPAKIYLMKIIVYSSLSKALSSSALLCRVKHL